MPSLPVRALVLLGIAIAAPLRAQTPAQIAPDRPLSLDQAMALALQNNYGLKAQTNTNESQREAYKITAAVFDPQLTASLTRGMTQQISNSSRLDGTVPPRSNTVNASLGVSKLIAATNGTLSVDFPLSKTASNDTNSLFNPLYTNRISFSYAQPLQTFGRAAAYSNIEIAKINLTINNYNYTNNILTLISNVENAYYNLVTQRESLAIRENTLNYSRLQADESRTRRQAGSEIDLNVASAELTYLQNQNALLNTQQQVREAEDNLLNIITAGTDFSVRPGPVQFEAYAGGVPNFAETYKLARENYTQTNSQEEQIKILQLQLDAARRTLRPNLRLNLGMGYSARNGNQGYWDVVESLPREHGENWSVGLNYTVNLGRVADKARYRQAQISIENGKIELQRLEQELFRQIRSAVRTIETNLSTVQLNAAATVQAQRQFEQTKARYDSGLATTLLVVQAQNSWDSAKNNELAAKLTLRRAISDLGRLTGTSFQRYNIQVPAK